MDIKNPDKKRELARGISENHWRNAYWFARILINGDKYGAIGKDNKLLFELSKGLKNIINGNNQSDDTKVDLSKDFLKSILDQRFSKTTGRSERIKVFYEDITKKFLSVKDVEVFVFTAENIMIPINIALETIPNNDLEFTETIAKAYLDELGDDALAKVIGLWDDAGVEGCLSAERVSVVHEFSYLRRAISSMPLSHLEKDMILTAFVQEFERRLGQKRKGRAGGSLEDVTSFLFKYYKIKAENAPDHFQADIEVDKWVKCKDKWLIGISCKRTLRERWKQVSSATREILSNYKIKELWHVVTFDEDLSDDKLALLGGMRHIFYLRDDSRRLASFKQKIGLKDYVRPMSQFINDLRNEIG